MRMNPRGVLDSLRLSIIIAIRIWYESNTAKISFLKQIARKIRPGSIAYWNNVTQNWLKLSSQLSQLRSWRRKGHRRYIFRYSDWSQWWIGRSGMSLIQQGAIDLLNGTRPDRSLLLHSLKIVLIAAFHGVSTVMFLRACLHLRWTAA